MPTIITKDNIRDLVNIYILKHSDLSEEYREELLEEHAWGEVHAWGNDLPEDLRDISMSDWDVSQVTNMDNLFKEIEDYEIEPLGKWDVSNVESMEGMFDNYLGAFIDVEDLSKWDVSNVKNMKNMFRKCDFNYKKSQTFKWDVSNVENMEGMFYDCRSFNGDLSNWNVSSVENMKEMFYGCESFNKDLSKWNVSGVENMEGMFLGCYKLKKTPKWTVSKTANIEDMFFSTPLKNSVLKRASYDRRDANKDVRNTNRLLNVLGRNKTRKNVQLPEIPEDIIYKTKHFFDPDELTKTIKKEKKYKIEDIKKGNVEELYLPPKPPSRKSEHPGGGGYAGGRRTKRRKIRSQLKRIKFH